MEKYYRKIKGLNILRPSKVFLGAITVLKMKKLTLILLFMSFSLSTAHATMPPLPDEPSLKNTKSCRLWSQKAIRSKENASSDIVYMWGLKDDGTSSRIIAVHRLSEFCRGKNPPMIVGFYSSVGTAERYCEDHASTRLCKRWKKEKLKSLTVDER